MPITELELPPGYCLCKKGGRPKRDARNVAVYLARNIRIKCHKESAKQADAWILEHWIRESGMSEDAHIRRAMRAARDLLVRHRIGLDRTHAIAMEKPIGVGSLGWAWCEGMPEAVSIFIKTLKEVDEVVSEMKPVALAARCVFLSPG
ncbi:hypothetical protein [Rhodoferax sp.]|uniref:hypothetical protein n=1 Tax=Rhodoferax sp. TaxID=50421 RepID=UPI0027215929|nr:hypothetical protein [Rhodoferax sp.]MDO8320601.1 hypothetical protein [Rhodoferax sp.]